jgi:GrpB protein
VLVVADTADEAAYVPDLETAGYVLHARDFHPTEHRPLTDHNREVQVHVLTIGDLEVERMLLFRDRLRRHPEDRELYERTKRELAALRWAYVQDYADAKSSVVEGSSTEPAQIERRSRSQDHFPRASRIARIGGRPLPAMRAWVRPRRRGTRLRYLDEPPQLWGWSA